MQQICTECSGCQTLYIKYQGSTIAPVFCDLEEPSLRRILTFSTSVTSVNMYSVKYLLCGRRHHALVERTKKGSGSERHGCESHCLQMSLYIPTFPSELEAEQNSCEHYSF